MIYHVQKIDLAALWRMHSRVVRVLRRKSSQVSTEIVWLNGRSNLTVRLEEI